MGRYRVGWNTDGRWSTGGFGSTARGCKYTASEIQGSGGIHEAGRIQRCGRGAGGRMDLAERRGSAESFAVGHPRKSADSRAAVDRTEELQYRILVEDRGVAEHTHLVPSREAPEHGCLEELGDGVEDILPVAIQDSWAANIRVRTAKGRL